MHPQHSNHKRLLGYGCLAVSCHIPAASLLLSRTGNHELRRGGLLIHEVGKHDTTGMSHDYRGSHGVQFTPSDWTDACAAVGLFSQTVRIVLFHYIGLRVNVD